MGTHALPYTFMSTPCLRAPVCLFTQARELKSVHVNVPAFYIRLVVQRCHVNKLNIYNQVWL